MSAGLRRGLADLACCVLQATLPPALRSWGWAVRCETAGIADDGAALRYAFNSLCGLLPRAVASHLRRPFTSPIGDGAIPTGGTIAMKLYDKAMQRPRAIGIACCIGAVTLGLVYMVIAGAPVHYLAINVGALVIGLATLFVLDRVTVTTRYWSDASIALMASALLATALIGSKVDGAARWVNLGSFSVQTSLLLLPLMLVLFARTRNTLAMACIIAAIVAIALQPDRAMAGMLAVGLAVLMVMLPGRHVITAFVASAVGFAVTLARADTLPAVPFVDQILYSSFDVHPAVGVAVLAGSALLLVPAVIGWYRDPANRPIFATFGAAWFVAVVAAAVGNYPTPIVGYGGSAIIGYALSLLALPKLSAPRAEAGRSASAATDTTRDDTQLLVAVA